MGGDASAQAAVKERGEKNVSSRRILARLGRLTMTGFQSLISDHFLDWVW